MLAHCLLLALGALCLLGASGAAAALPTQFGEEGEGAGQFIEATGIAIDSESGNVVLADTANNRVEEFTGEGQFLRTWGWGVRDGKAEFEICEAPARCRAGEPGSGAGQFGERGASGVAIDNSAGLTHGDIYVVDRANRRVERFAPDGEFILSFGEAGSGPGQFQGLGLNAVAVGPTGTIYVADIGRVEKFSPAGAFEGEISLPAIGGIAGLLVDSAGELYVLAMGGVRKFNGSGEEQGAPRDPSANAIALGPGDELFVEDPNQGHILSYDPSGAQTRSLLLPDPEGAFGGLAYANGTLYILYDAPPAVRLQSIPPPGPEILSEKAGQLQPTSATLEATINPEGKETHYHFQYGESSAYTNSTAEETLGASFNDEPVEAPITGLKPATTYHFRVLAESAAGKVEGPDETFQTLPPVSIESEAASEVSADSAKLSTQLNPHGLPTEYHFEYGTTTAYGQLAPVPDGQAGEGTEPVSFSVRIQHLSPNTTYHYRVAARNALNGEGEYTLGPDQSFTTQGEEHLALPDGRAWEMVSPERKHGAALEPISLEGAVIQAAGDGSGLAYTATGPVEEPQGSNSAAPEQLLSERSAPGVWSTQDIATPHKAPTGLHPGIATEYKLFSSDLSRGALEPAGSTPLAPRPSEPSEPDAERTPYLRNADGTFTPLVWKGNVPAGTKFGGEEIQTEIFAGGVRLVTGTPDLRHVLVESPSSLVEGFENEGFQNIYEWSEGRLEPVSVLPSGASAGGTVGNESFQVRGAISTDGSRVFFTAGIGHLYMRDMLLGPSGKTLRIDAPEAGIKESSFAASFQLATPDGSKVYFTDEARLTSDAKAKAGQPDLYECEIEVTGEEPRCKLRDLSVDPHANEGANVQGDVIGAGEDGRRIYFVAKGALGSSGQEAKGGVCPQPDEGECVNLYEYDTHSAAPQPRLVAVLSGEDAPDWSGGTTGGGPTDLGEMTARVSPDGRYLAFMSKRSLTGYDNRDAKNASVRDQEVYEYDSQTGRLSCASCDPTGQRPVGVFDPGKFPGLLVDAPLLWQGQTLAGSIPGWTRLAHLRAEYQSRYLSNSGRLFFNSPVGLVPGDGNSVEDVYEYEPQGVGSCASAPACVGLISGGSSSEESAFLDASESGDDVFFLSAAELSFTDSDTALDVYDAHVCSSAPGCAQPPLGAPPPCATADSCRAAATPQPGIFGAPASATLSGPGNPTPAVTPKAKAKHLTRAQKLRRALAACHKKPKRARARCERIARKRYGPLKKAKGKKASHAQRGRAGR
jgi:hypothetical protein